MSSTRPASDVAPERHSTPAEPHDNLRGLTGDRLFRAIFDSTFQFIAVLAPDGVVREVNRTALEFAGLTRADVVGTLFWETPWWRLSAEVRERLREAVAQAAAGSLVRYDADVAGSGDSRALIDFSLKPVYGQDGGVALLVAEGRDVTEARWAERALRVSEAKFAGIVSIASDAIISVDAEHRIIHFNRGAEAIFGYAADQVLGEKLDLLLPRRFRASHDEHVARFAAGPVAARRMGERREIAGLRANGEEFPAEASISRLDLDGERILTVVLRDITQRKRAEAAQALLVRVGEVLASSLDYDTTLQEVVQLAVPMLADFCSIIILEDDGTMRRHALAHADAALQPLLDQLRDVPLDPASAHPSIRAIDSGRLEVVPDITPDYLEAMSGRDTLLLELYRRLEPRTALAVPLTARGQTFGAMAFFSATPRRYDEGELNLAGDLGLRAAFAVANARLYRATREAVRTRDDVLAVVSHDLGNPLSAIRIGTSLLLRSMPEEERGSGGWHHLEAIRESAQQMERLIRDLMEVKRLEQGHLNLQRRGVRVRPLIAELCEQLLPIAGEKGIELVGRVADDVPDVLADRDRIHQVFSNLVGNALRFTPAGGTITLSAQASADGVQCSVQDTGPGIPEADAPHVFDRFWQGRRDGRSGVGLGLTISRGIILAHGGRIWVESVPGRGATFHFTLPEFTGGADQGGAVRL